MAVRPAAPRWVSGHRGGRRRARRLGRAARPADGRAGFGIARSTVAGDVGRLHPVRRTRHPLRHRGVEAERLAVGVFWTNGAGAGQRSLATDGPGATISSRGCWPSAVRPVHSLPNEPYWTRASVARGWKSSVAQMLRRTWDASRLPEGLTRAGRFRRAPVARGHGSQASRVGRGDVGYEGSGVRGQGSGAGDQKSRIRD